MHPFLRSKFTAIVLAVLAVWLIILAVASGIRRHADEADLTALRTRIEDTERENARLAAELERMKQPQWLALLARQRLNYKLPDETVVFVYKSEKAGTIAQPQTTQEQSEPSWKQWLDWLRGT